jgi:diguanylate cyclase (GGDEF)-like protein
MPPSPSRTRTLRYAAFGVALLVLAAVGVATMWSFQRTAVGFDLVQHTYHVIVRLQEYRATLRSAESAARGYRLTGNQAMKLEFSTNATAIDRQLADLAVTVADSPLQAGRVLQLRTLTGQRLELSRRLIANGQTRTPASLQRAAAAAKASAAIETLATTMLRTEQEYLAARRDRALREARLLIGFAGGGTAFAIVLLALLMRGLQREIKHSRELERQTREAAAGLETSLAELARVSEQHRVLGRYASLLQSCESVEEALRITGQVVSALIPGTGGRCYLLRASQDLAETAIEFGSPVVPSADLLQPAQCWALRRGTPFAAEDLVTGIHCTHVDTRSVPAGSWTLCVPLLAQGIALGMLHVSGPARRSLPDSRSLVESVAEQLGLALVNLQLRESLRMQSLRDPLTGLYNRRYLDESLQREVLRCQRRGFPLAVLMLDVDHFKSFNDRNGHAAGDAMLAAIGHALQASARSEDLVCRYGGEEFTIVLVEAGAADALRRAEEIRAAVGGTTVQHLKRTLGPCTASIGLAMLPQDGVTPAELLEAADAALYRAKAHGRDRIEVATPV